MNDDLIIAEIHQARARLLAECNGDLDRLLDRYQASENPKRVVTLRDVDQRRQGIMPHLSPEKAGP